MVYQDAMKYKVSVALIEIKCGSNSDFRAELPSKDDKYIFCVTGLS